MSFSGTKGYLTKPKPGVMLNPLHPLSRGLVGYWLFNEGSGSRAYDISGYSNHGTLKNMLPNVQSSGWGSSKFGGGLWFDGTNDYVDISTAISDFSVDTGAVGMWVNFSVLPGQTKYIYSAWTNSDNNIEIVLSGTISQLRFKYKAGGTTESIDIPYANLNVNTDYYLFMTWNQTSNEFKVYINGIQQGSTQTIANAYVGSVSTMYLGEKGSDAGQYYKNGLIDTTLIYNREPSLFEIKQLSHDPFCNLIQVPIRRYPVAAPSVGAIMNQFQRANIGADLYNGVLA